MKIDLFILLKIIFYIFENYFNILILKNNFLKDIILIYF